MDSIVLLHLVAQQTDYPVLVVHVHHGLQAQADAWAAHVAELAEKYQQPCHTLTIQPDPDNGGLEAAARQARYAALKGIIEPGDCLLTAHHADDQVETVCLRVLRGTGPMGLVGIRHCQVFGAGHLLRPLLDTPYEALREYAQTHELSWMDDPSNQDVSFERNYLRHQVLPLLRKRWPSLERTIGRLAGLTEEAERVYNELLAERLRQHRVATTPLLSVATLAQETPSMQHALVREWIAELSWRPPTQRQLAQGLRDLLSADEDRQPLLRWSDGQLARFRGVLYRLPRTLPISPLKGTIRRGEVSPWGSVGSVCWIASELAEQANVLGLRPFKAGDRIQLPNRPAQAAKELFRQAGIPPWWRACLPVVINERSEPIALAGIAPSAAFEFVANTDPGLGDWRYWHG